MTGEVLALVGMSGVGKSHLARRLAGAGFRVHDCDAAIAAALTSIVTPDEGEPPVIALGRWMGMPFSHGYKKREARYLTLERDVTAEALTAALADRASGPQVIDTTGSVIYGGEALLSDLKSAARVVYLRTSESARAAALERYLHEPKPVAWNGVFEARDGETSAQAIARCYPALLESRDRAYAALAHVTIDAERVRGIDAEAFLALIG